MTAQPPKVDVDTGLIIPKSPGTAFAMMGTERNAVESPSAAATSITSTGAGVGTSGPQAYVGLTGDTYNGEVTHGAGMTLDHKGLGASAFVRYQHLSDDKRTLLEMGAETTMGTQRGLSASTDLFLKHKPDGGFISPYLRAKFSTEAKPRLTLGACVQEAVTVPMIGKVDICAETRTSPGEKAKPRLAVQKSL